MTGAPRSCCLALDVGGTRIRGALVRAAPPGEAPRVLARHDAATPPRDPGLAGTVEVTRLLVDEAQRAGLTVAAIGAGFPEYVASDGRLTSTEVLDWAEQPAELLAPYAARVVVESDVRCAALAEALAPGRQPGEPGADDFLFVSWGTGLSCALVSDRRVRRGARGEAIGLGEWPVGGLGGGSATDRATAESTLEGFASGAGLARRYAAATGGPTAAEGSGARGVLTAAAAGDPLALEVVESAGRAVGAALGSLIRLLDPGALVLGGGLGTAAPRHPALWQPLLSAYADRVGARPGAPAPTIGHWGDQAGLWGAAWIALEGCQDAQPD